MSRWQLLCGWAMGTVLLLSTRPAAADMPAKITYQDHIQPIFREKCFSCHNPDKKSGGLDLTSYTSVMLGGSSGEVIEPGSPDGSYLYQLVTHQSEPFMPPNSDPIPQAMQDLIKAWIEQGALENSGSKPVASKKAKPNVALAGPSLERPAQVAMPGHWELEPVVVPEVPGTISGLASSPWAPLIAVGSQKQVLLYHAQSLELLGIVPFPEGFPYVVRFSRNGDLLLAGGGHNAASGRVVVWDVRTGERLIEAGDELDAVLAADISSDQTLIALGGPQKVVRAYNTADGQLRYELRKHTDWVLSLEFSPDGVLLATGDRAGNLFVWEALTGREYLTLKGHSAAVTGLSWRADSNVLASASEDGTVRLWEMENGNQIKNWNAHGQGVLAIEFARDGRLVTTGRDRVVKIWNQDGTLQRSFDAMDDIGMCVTICDETNRAVGGDWRGTLRVWDAAQGTLVGTLAANPPSIQTRLEQAQQLLAQRQAEAAPLAKAAEQAATEWKTLSDKASALSQEQQQVRSRLDAVQKALEADRQKKVDAEKRAEDLTARKNALQTAVAALDQAVAAASQASKALPNDQELSQLVPAAEKLLKERRQQLQVAQNALNETASLIEQLHKRIDEQTAQLTQLDQQLKQLQVELDKVAPLVQAAAEKKQAAEAALAKAQQAVSEAQSQVDRWRTEQQFVEQLRAWRSQQTQLEQQAQQQAAQMAQLADLIAAREKELAEVAAQLATAQNEHQQAQQAFEQARQQLQSAEQTRKEVEAQLSGARQQIDQLEQGLAALAEAIQKTQAAADSTKDKELVAAVDGLKKVAERKQGELEQKRQEVPGLEKQLEQAVQAATAAQAMVQAAKQTLDSKAAQLAQYQQAHQQRMAQLEAARKEHQTAQSAYERLVAESEAITNRILQAKVAANQPPQS